MELLLYKENQRIHRAELLINGKKLSIDAPDKLMAELLNFEWYDFSYCYEALASCECDPAGSCFEKNIKKQLSSLSDDARDVLINALVSVRDNWLIDYMPESMIPHDLDSDELPICKEFVRELNNICPLIFAIHSSIESRKDYDYFQYIMHYAFGYNFTPYLYYPKKLSAQQVFGIIRDYRPNPKESSNNQFNTEVDRILSARSAKEYWDHFQSLAKTAYEHNRESEFNGFLNWYLWEGPNFSETSTERLLSEYIDEFCKFVSTSASSRLKVYVAEEIYKILNTPPYPSLPDVHTCNNLLELMCCLVLSYYKQQTPLSLCPYCHKVFVRLANSQKTCKSKDCQKTAASSQATRSIELFGKNLFGVLNNVRKRLCYSGSGRESKYDVQRYCHCGITPAASEIIVKKLSEINKKYIEELNIHINKILSIPDWAREDYVDLVNDWINKIDSYYRNKNISNLITEGVYSDTSPKNKKFIVKCFSIDPLCPCEIISTNIEIPIT